MASSTPERDIRKLTVDGMRPIGIASGSDAVETLVRNLKRIKLWTWLRGQDKDVAEILADQSRVEKALRVMDSEDKTEEDLKKEVFDALNLEEKGREQIKNQTLTSILNSRTGNAAQTDTEIEHNGQTHTIDEWVDELRVNPDRAIIDKVDQRLKEVLHKYGPENLKGVESGRSLGELEDTLDKLRIEEEIRKAKMQAKLTGGKTAVGRLFAKELEDETSTRLLQVRRGSQQTQKWLKTLTQRVQQESLDTLTEEDLEALSSEDLVKRFNHVNTLRSNITRLIDTSMSDDDQNKLRTLLIGIQTQYENAMAKKILEEWKRGNRSGEWNERISRDALHKTLEEKRKFGDPRVKWDEEPNGRWREITQGIEAIAKDMVEKERRATWKSKEPSSSRESSSGNDYAAIKRRKALEGELDRVLGPGNTYNLLEDLELWEDLADGEEGIRRILSRARVADERSFREMLIRMRAEKEMPMRRPRYGMDERDNFDSDEIPFPVQLGLLLRDKRFGAAANLMLEYSTRVGVRENSQDLEFMMIKRNFLNSLTHKSPDFAAQFEMNQVLGYLPNLASQKPEDFLESFKRLHSKGNLDIILGDNAMMGGNVVEFGDKKVTFSVKTFKSLLRDDRYLMRVLSADPNTMDSTLQGIMLEEMYGRGTRMLLRQNPDTKERELYLALPGQTDAQARRMKDIRVDMRFADLDIGGFNRWSKDDVERDISLEDMLNRNQWILRDGMTMMWYSEEWKQVAAAKSYQTALMGAAPKSLLTSDVAKAVYQLHFGNVPPPMAELAEVFGGMLSAMSVYKAKDMVGGNVAKQMWAGLNGEILSEEDVRGAHTRFGQIGDLFVKMHVRDRIAAVGDEKIKFKNRLRTNEMARFAFNDFAEDGPQVLELLRHKFENQKMVGIPSDEELKGYYKLWKEARARRELPKSADGKTDSKAAFFGQEYDAIWQEVNELKMTSEERKTWDAMSWNELKVLWKMNDKTFGRPNESRELVILDGETPKTALARMKKQFLSEMHIGAFVAQAGTKNGDDWEQYAMKYAPAKYEALSYLYKLISLKGSLMDAGEMISKLQLFMEPQDRYAAASILENRLYLATSAQLLTPLRIPLTTSRRHQKEHPGWKFWEQEDPELRGTNDIEWIKFTDQNNNTYFATTVNGDRAYEEEDYRGNWSSRELGVDHWRPSDFELLNMELRTRGLVDKHSMHILNERALGAHRDVDSVIGGALAKLGFSEQARHRVVDFVSKWSTRAKLLAFKLFFFNDPKYALWTLAHDVAGFGGKVFEQIFGISVSGSRQGH